MSQLFYTNTEKACEVLFYANLLLLFNILSKEVIFRHIKLNYDRYVHSKMID